MTLSDKEYYQIYAPRRFKQSLPPTLRAIGIITFASLRITYFDPELTPNEVHTIMDPDSIHPSRMEYEDAAQILETKLIQAYERRKLAGRFKRYETVIMPTHIEAHEANSSCYRR